jgi:hypothetical protein
MLLAAVSLPWVRIHIPAGPTTAVLGSPITYATYDVRTYGLAALQSAAIEVVADWVILLGLVVLSWRVPRWRRPLTITAMVLVGFLLLVIFGLGHTAANSIAADQLPKDAYLPGVTTDYLGGVWLGTIGAVVLLSAVALRDLSTQEAQSDDQQAVGG